MTEKKGFKAKVKDAAKGIASKVAAGFGYDLTAKFDIETGSIELPIDMAGDTVWATQQQIADLFGTKRQAITKHIRKIYDEGELDEKATSSKMELVRIEGQREVSRSLEHYNLDMILAVGYRVSGKKATEFRKWANSVLRGYIEDGYALNGKRLDADPQALLRLAQDVRTIRTSEKNLYAQVREVFKLAAIDYDPSSDEAGKFFAESQDTFHWAASQETASEILSSRCDATKPNLGLTALGNRKATKSDVVVAKNFMSESELKKMQLMGDAFLGYVEGIALQEKQVSMARLLVKLQELIEIYDYPVFPGYAAINRPTGPQAKEYAKAQYDLFKGNGHQALPSN